MTALRAILFAIVLAILTIDLVIEARILSAEHLYDNVKLEDTFSRFVQLNERAYNSSTHESYSVRKAIFKQNMLKVSKLNKSQRGNAKFGVSIFADHTQPEFKQLLGYKPRLASKSIEDDGLEFEVLFNDLLKEENKTEKQLSESMPSSFDWRQHNGVVTDVKDQGSSCGSCWSFATTGNIEGLYKVRKNMTLSLSEQELIDCDKVDQGCNGGLPELAYKQVIEFGGLETEADYPYKSYQSTCSTKKSVRKYSIDNFTHLTPNDEKRMQIWLTKRGPISIAIDAESIKYYLEGVYYPAEGDCFKEPEKLNHAVLLVGYGVDTEYKTELPYWIVKNSWGSKWGEGGYFRIYRGDNTCGLANDPTTAVLVTGDKDIETLEELQDSTMSST